MDILPAIDLLDGKVVRLSRGDYDQRTVYSDAPADVAARFLDAGAAWIHVVDLNAARGGEPTNTNALAAVCRLAGERGARVQTGGGVRDRASIDRLLAVGVSRLVIGSAAMKNWPWFEALLTDDAMPNERFALGLDARDGYLAAEGWTEQLDITAADLAERVSGSGLGAIVYTDIARDGMLTGVNYGATRRLIEATDAPVIASGGVAGIEDVRRCGEIGCAGVIVGRAYYEGRIDIRQALAAAGSQAGMDS